MALSEVNQILLHTEDNIILKIPEQFIDFVKKNMDENHIIKIEEGKDLIEQNIMQETKEILALIYRDYLCSKEERENLIRQEQQEWEKEEKENQEKYNINFEKIKEDREQKN